MTGFRIGRFSATFEWRKPPSMLEMVWFDADLLPPGGMTCDSAETMMAKVKAASRVMDVGDWVSVRLPDGSRTLYEVTDHNGGLKAVDPLP